MNIISKITLFFLASTLFLSCKEDFNPPVDDSQTRYLVVEGILNNGGLTTIRLSRTRPLNEDLEKPELNAVVSVQDDSNQSYALNDQGAGVHTIQINLNKTKKYRLNIKTSGGKEYRSDFVSVLTTPPIDQVTWEKKDSGLEIYADSHDPANNSRYYRWGFEETWIRNVPMNSLYEYVNGKIQARKIPTRQQCFDTQLTDPLTIASTIKLSEDVVSKALVNLIPSGSAKLADKYSILLKQHTLDKPAYEYWLAMRKNTEQLGSIFDPQPSYMYGNIRAVSDPTELVIGYFGASNVTEKRIFITGQETSWVYRPGEQCDLKVVPFAEIDFRFGTGGGRLGWIPIVDIPFTSDWYGVTTMACADCGSNWVKPLWWN